MITPAVLISAAALVLLSTAARLGRVNDRLHALIGNAERLQANADSPATLQQQRALTQDQLGSLLERLLLLRSAVIGIYLTIALLVITSISAGMYAVFPQITNIFPISLGLLGSVAFLYSIVLLIREAAIAVQITLREIAFVRQTLQTPTAASLPLGNEHPHELPSLLQPV